MIWEHLKAFWRDTVSAHFIGWHARQREIDMQVLWPECLRNASSLDEAKAAFAVHAFNDKAWLCLGKDAVYKHIDGLEGEVGGKDGSPS